LGEELFNYEKFNFPSLRSLEEAVVSYRICEWSNMDGVYSSEYLVWRNNGKKNVLHQDMHGDMYVSQVDVSGNDEEILTLFGAKTVFDSMKVSPDRGGVYGYQDWSGYLLAGLKFAERLGKPKMPEIVNWHDYYKSTHMGGNYSEAGSDASMDIQHYTTRPVISKGEKLDNFPLSICGWDQNYKYPYFEDDKLFYIQEDKKGNIDLSDLAPFLKDKKFSKDVEYSESDLPNILKGCYKLFSRVVANMIFIMKDFNEKHS
jgi:hypothetical protein